MKIYGNEKTDLVLSDKAYEVYSNTDPLNIIEEDDGTYSMKGCFGRYGMTAEDVNRFFEELADIVVNNYGVQIDINQALNLMDEEIYQELDAKLNPCSNQEFFDAYCEAHEEKYGEPWELAKPNPVY